MFYIKEEERGFYPEEDLIIPGRYEVVIKPRETKEITFVASLEDNTEQIDSNKVFEEEINRLEKIIENTELIKQKSKLSKQDKDYNELVKSLLIASESFIINRQSFGTHSVIAGFPWFLDWGRDSLIAFEGMFLITKRYDLAKEILLTFTRDIKYGLVPNGYSGFDNRPLYNSADASLLLFEQVNKFLQYTKDYDFIKENIYENLSIIPSNVNLAGAEIELIGVEDKENLLKNALKLVKDKYNFILIDCPPSLNMLTINSMCAGNTVLVPIQCEYYALEGLGQLLNTINLVKKHLNKNILLLKK